MTEVQFSQDSESAIFSIVFNNPEIIYSLPSLKTFMFSSTTNQLIYSTILELSGRSLLPDFSLVLSSLESTGKLNDAGGKEYLNYLRNLVFNKDNIKEYERQVINNYKAMSLLSRLTETKVKISSGKDVSEIIGDFRHQLENLEETSGGEQVIDFRTANEETWENIVKRRENPGIRGITTGFPDIDTITGGYNPGDLWVVAGRPGMGKSADMCNTALAVAEAGQPVLIFSLEMNKNALVERMISIKSGVPLADIRLGSLDQEKMDKISACIASIKNLPVFIDTNFDADETYFSITIRKYHSLKGIKVIFFDYIQLASERGNNQTAEIGAFSRSAKLLANDLGITVVVYSQLNRLVEARDDKRPQLSDLRQSGNLEEDADIVLFLYRDEYYSPQTTKQPGVMEKIFKKHRNGPIGTFFYRFNEQNLKITEERNAR